MIEEGKQLRGDGGERRIFRALCRSMDRGEVVSFGSPDWFVIPSDVYEVSF